MNHSLPTVSARGVLTTTRAVFVLAAALLAPLMAQYLFGAGVHAATWVMVSVVAALAALAVSRLVVRDDGSAWPALRVLAAGKFVGLGAGVLLSLAWMVFEHPSYQTRYYPVAALFGALYGAFAGAGFGAAFALWTRRARGALSRPSAVASQRLAMEAGLALSVAGALGVALYRIDALSLASGFVGLVGIVTIVAAIARTVRLQKLFTAVTRGDAGFVVTPRSYATAAPAFVWAPTLDQVIVRSGDPAPIEPSPFRAQNPAAEVAAVPSDLSIVRRAIGGAVAFGFVAVMAAGAMQFGAFAFTCTTHCPSSGGCSGCSH